MYTCTRTMSSNSVAPQYKDPQRNALKVKPGFKTAPPLSTSVDYERYARRHEKSDFANSVVVDTSTAVCYTRCTALLYRSSSNCFLVLRTVNNRDDYSLAATAYSTTS